MRYYIVDSMGNVCADCQRKEKAEIWIEEYKLNNPEEEYSIVEGR